MIRDSSARGAHCHLDVRQTLAQGLADTIGAAIVVGNVGGGELFTEAELSARYAVSRSVTREAMKILASKGLVSARPRSGTSVEPQSSWDLLDPDVLRWIFRKGVPNDLTRGVDAVRWAVGPQAAALAAVNRDRRHLNEIAGALARLETAHAESADVTDAEIAFHEGVLRASRNPFVLQCRHLVSHSVRAHVALDRRIGGESFGASARRVVLDAIEAERSDEAREAMRAVLAEHLVDPTWI